MDMLFNTEIYAESMIIWKGLPDYPGKGPDNRPTPTNSFNYRTSPYYSTMF